MSISANVDLGHVQVKGTAECLGGHQLDPPLSDYPMLVLAPFQWGPGVREHLRGVTVEAIAHAFAVSPNVEAVAGQFGIESDAVVQAVQYASAVGFLASK